MIEFSVEGPFSITVTKGKAGKGIEKTNIKRFLDANHLHIVSRGVYVFAARASKGFVPWYIGRATTSFAQECFTSDKINKFNEALRKFKRGTPVLFFIKHPTKRGAINKGAIAAVERELIKTAWRANRKLLNKHHTKEPQWAIRGVMRAKQGQPTTSAQDLKTTLGL